MVSYCPSSYPNCRINVLVFALNLSIIRKGRINRTPPPHPTTPTKSRGSGGNSLDSSDKEYKYLCCTGTYSSNRSDAAVEFGLCNTKSCNNTRDHKQRGIRPYITRQTVWAREKVGHLLGLDRG